MPFTASASSARSLLRLLVVLGAGAALASACGGSTLGDGTGNVAEGDAGAARDGASAATNDGGIARPPAPDRCGNGVIDGTEMCDGADLGSYTCSAATMGARTGGVLRCDSTCNFNTTGCSSGEFGWGGAGGGVNQGGSGGGVSRGGSAGAGTGGGVAYDAGALCNAADGAPDPANPVLCQYGADAVAACQVWVARRIPQASPSCSIGCGCLDSCAPLVAQCMADGPCGAILGCVQSSACTASGRSCVSGCAAVAGGSAFTKLADQAVACLEMTGCSLSCGAASTPAD